MIALLSINFGIFSVRFLLSFFLFLVFFSANFCMHTMPYIEIMRSCRNLWLVANDKCGGRMRKRERNRLHATFLSIFSHSRYFFILSLLVPFLHFLSKTWYIQTTVRVFHVERQHTGRIDTNTCTLWNTLV